MLAQRSSQKSRRDRRAASARARGAGPAPPASETLQPHPRTPLAFSVSTTSARSSRRTSGSSCAARSPCSRSVQSRRQTPGRGAARAAGALIRAGAADALDEQRVDAAVRIEARHLRQPGSRSPRARHRWSARSPRRSSRRSLSAARSAPPRHPAASTGSSPCSGSTRNSRRHAGIAVTASMVRLIS